MVITQQAKPPKKFGQSKNIVLTSIPNWNAAEPGEKISNYGRVGIRLT